VWAERVNNLDMPTVNADQIEREFSELPTQLQLSLLERLVQQVRTKMSGDDKQFASELAAMASDADMRRELAAIDTEFRQTEQDGLGKG
jgi:hypothetical protein